MLRFCCVFLLLVLVSLFISKLYNLSTVFFDLDAVAGFFKIRVVWLVPVPNSDTYLLLFIGLFSFLLGLYRDLKKWFGEKYFLENLKTM